MKSNNSLTKKLNIGVFTSASNRLDKKYFDLANELGKYLSQLGHSVIYGGAQIGMMGALAEGALSHGGKVIGVYPQNLTDREVSHPGLSELIITKGLHDRKKTIYEKSDLFITLPGGFGTLDETFEVLTWNQLGHIKKPLYFFNHQNFFEHLIQFIKELEQKNFIKVYDDVGAKFFSNFNELATILKTNQEKKNGL